MPVSIKKTSPKSSLKKISRNSSIKTPPKLSPKEPKLSPKDKKNSSFKLKTRKNKNRKTKKITSEDLPPSNYPLVYASNKYKASIDNILSLTGMELSFKSPKSIISTLSPSSEKYISPENNGSIYTEYELDELFGKEGYYKKNKDKTPSPVTDKTPSPVKPKGVNPFARKGSPIKNPFFPNNVK